MGKTYYFSCNEKNSSLFFNLLLNHSGVSNLNLLIAHNYYFFKESFEHISILDLSLRFKRGFNYTGLGSSVKNRYFSDLKEIIVDFYFQRCGVGYRDGRNAINMSRGFLGNDCQYFVSPVEKIYHEEPVNDKYYMDSKPLELYNVDQELEEYYRSRKLCDRRFQKKSIIEVLNSMSYHGVEDSIEDELFEFHHPLERYGISDLTEAEEKELKDAKSYASKNRGKITRDVEEYIIRKFNYLDINHLNRPFIIPDAIKDIFEGVEEKLKLDLEAFKFSHGLRGVEVSGVENKMEEMKSAAKYLKERLTYMGGISKESVPEEIWNKHMVMLKSLKAINKKQLKASEKIDKMERKNYEEMMVTYLAKKCQIMLDIKSLYPKYTYIQDEYLDRDTEEMKKINICKLVKYGLIYFRDKAKVGETSKEMPDRSVFAAEFGPSINDLKEGKTALDPEEAEDIALSFFKTSVEGVKHTLDLEGSGFSGKYAERFLGYLSEAKNERSKNFDPALQRLKDNHNSLVKTKKNWDDMDRQFFLKNLEMIFELDDDFEKYLTSGLKKSSLEAMDKIKDLIRGVISDSFLNPIYTEEKGRHDSIVIDKKKVEYKEKSPLEGMLKFIESFINVDKGKSKFKNVKIAELDDKSYERKKLKYRNLPDESWKERSKKAHMSLAKVINNYISIYNSLGDSINLSPHKLGLDMAYCTCEKEEDKINTHHIHIPNFTDEEFKSWMVRGPEIMEKKNNLENLDLRIKDLTEKKNNYLDFVKNNKEIEEKNRIFRENRLKEELEKAKLKKAEEEVNRIKDYFSRLKEDRENSRRKRADEVRKCADILNSLVEKRNLEVKKNNRNMMDKYKSDISRELNSQFNISQNLQRKIAVDISLYLTDLESAGLSHEEECNAMKEKVIELKKEIKAFRRTDKNVVLKKEEPGPVGNRFSLLMDEEEDDSLQEDYEEDEYVAPKKAVRPEVKTVAENFPALVEFENRYEVLYRNEEIVREADKMTNLFFSTSKNLEVICRRDVIRRKAELIRNGIEETIEEYGYCSKIGRQAINESFGSHYIKKYNVRKFREVIHLMFVCHKSNVYLDYSYIKLKYGMKRCQSKYLVKAIQLSLNKMIGIMNKGRQSLRKDLEEI